MLKSLLGKAIRKLGRLYRYAFPRTLTQGERQFIDANTAFWSAQHAGVERSKEYVRYVLVEDASHPLIFSCNASFATIVANARDLRPLFILRSSRNTALKRILKSYNPNIAFVFINDWRYLIPSVVARIKALNAFRALRSPTDILDFSVDGIRFGDLVYDEVLNEGFATIRKLDGRVVRALQAFFYWRYVSLDIIKRFDIEASVFSHTTGIESGVFIRYLLHNGKDVVQRTGSHQLQVIKRQKPSDAFLHCLKPEPQYFRFMTGERSAEILRRADNYLNDRFNQDIEDSTVGLAFNRRKHTFFSREEFCHQLGLDSDSKTVFVMLHAFNDAPHSSFGRRMFFRDYGDWFEKTLEIAKSIGTVNWVFKEHPAAHHYPVKDIDLDAVFQGVQESHIRFLNRKSDFNARSIPHVGDVIITCMGTALLEYSSVGMPCVLAGESPYSGFGFTIEPHDSTDYENQLRHIGELPRLNESQVKAAKAVMFFQLSMMQGANYLFCPPYNAQQIREFKPDDFWRDTAELMRNGDWVSMKRQINIISDFIRDPSYTQYIDLEQYDFMREAIYQETA